MCGIFGFCGVKGGSVDFLNSALPALRHRGPDAHGKWFSADGQYGLGHRRLAILDLSETGSQPMKDENTGNVISFNGEIYNSPELRRELISKGIEFLGTSDTETILRGFGIWGSEIFARLRGMFALAIYQRSSQNLILARDFFGIKPLYWGRDRKDQFLFCSEVRALLPFTDRGLDAHGVSGYLLSGCCPHRHLIYKNIFEFPAGHWARIDSQTSEFFIRKFVPDSTTTSFPHNCEKRPGKSQLVWRVRSLLENAVQSHLLSDVPVACFLSGGMDSTILATLASREAKELATFSVGFSETSFDESSYAKEVAKLIGSTHHHIELLEGEKAEMVKSAVQAMDLPSVDGINTYMISQQASRAGFKVVLSGLGADEIFGGYPIFRDFSWIRMLSSTPKWARRVGTLFRPGFQLLTDIPQEKTGQALAWWWRRVWTGHDLQNLGMDVPIFESEISPPLRDSMAEISWGEISCYLRDMLLRDSDCMSMAHSLELRVPFLDAPLVEEILALPSALKFDPRFPKSLLLRATKDLLPERSWNRPKMGFSFPMELWMRRPLRDFCRQGLELAQGHLALNLRQTEIIWQKWESKKFVWPKLWALVVLGHYLDSKGDA
jgi:asparagine synthase (glutamine-hydrolysing)